MRLCFQGDGRTPGRADDDRLRRRGQRLRRLADGSGKFKNLVFARHSRRVTR